MEQIVRATVGYISQVHIRLIRGEPHPCAIIATTSTSIARYRNILRSIIDRRTEEGATVMIAELEEQKVALHPPPPFVEHFASRIGNVGVSSPALRRFARGARRY
jgi:hypothetical protein